MKSGFTDAADFGFSPEETGVANTRALQAAVDRGGTIVVSVPGRYAVAGTVYVGSDTTLSFGNGVVLQKVEEEPGPFTHVLLNKGARERRWDRNIVIEGLHISVNGVDVRKFEVYGLHGQLAFFYVRDLRIERFRCYDMGPVQYAVHVCTFEDLIIDDVIIHGDKDGVHLGRGRRFTIRNGIFKTFDDAVALNAHDWTVGNPELGWIEDGVVENCQDLDAEGTTGYFCRILGGGWLDWYPGMEVRRCDSVVHGGRLYRVDSQPDGTVFRSRTAPSHEEGLVEIDGIPWRMMQDEAVYTAGVRNVTFRDIVLKKARIAFSIHFCNNKWSRSYYPGAELPLQGPFRFEGIQVAHDEPMDFLAIRTPVDCLSVVGASLGEHPIRFFANSGAIDFGRTCLSLTNCIFRHAGPMELMINEIADKPIEMKTTGSLIQDSEFEGRCTGHGESVRIHSDLPGLSGEPGAD